MASDPSTPDPLLGTTLADRYRIIRRLGVGGMGAVYLAEHVMLGRPVALKLLKPELAQEHGLVERFFREARATAAIRHENVVDILDFGQTPEYSFFVMEALAGCELADLLRGGNRVPWTRAQSILIQVARGLGAAHERGVIHRDMKPGNVFLTRRGETADVVKILDFGIAKIDDGKQLTQAGMVFGTAAYMAPEQAMGGEVDARTDVYALGCVMYEVLTGRPPFADGPFMQVVSQHMRETPPPLHTIVPELARELPPGVQEVISKALGKFPEDRFPNMRALELALAGIAGAAQPAEPAAPSPSEVPLPFVDVSLLATLGYLFVAFAKGTDGVLTNAEMRALAERLRAWAPHAPLDQIGGILRDAVAIYTRTATDPAHLRSCRATLAAAIDADRRPQIIADLREIALADGRFDAAEQQFIDETAHALGLARPPMVQSLAFIYLVVAHAADGAVDTEELRVVTEQLQQWAPDASIHEAAAALRAAVVEYRGLAGNEARLDHARAAADTIRQTAPKETRQRILADLWRIAGSDGHISPEEQRFIMDVVARFNAP